MKVEKNIPLPAKFPFAQMQPGDSFLIEGTKRHTVAVAAIRYGKKHNMKFSTRKQADGSFRCWRLS